MRERGEYIGETVSLAAIGWSGLGVPPNQVRERRKQKIGAKGPVSWKKTANGIPGGKVRIG